MEFRESGYFCQIIGSCSIPIEEWFKNKELDDRKGREDVSVLLSADSKPLSAEQVRIWIDNFRASMKRKKTGEDKQSEPNDKE